MLNNLFKRFKSNGAEEPAIDLSLGYPRLNEFKNYLVNGEFANFENEYEKLTWDAKTLLNEGIGLNATCAGSIDKWVAEEPGSYIAQLFAGVSKTCLAWIERTAAMGSAVSEKRAERFISLLEEAMAHLNEADEINPEDPEICARTIRVCMGLGAATEATQSYFEAAAALQPNHLMAHLMMINYLSPKWMGSLEEMHDFANERYEEAGSSLLLTLKLFAITEEWVYYDINNEKEKRKAFFKNQELRSMLLEMYNGFTEEEDGQLLVPYVYNYFAFLFHQFNEKELASTLIKKINGKMTVYPWAYIGIENNNQLQKL